MYAIVMKGQTIDIHKHIQYYPKSQQLKLKYEYYYDRWEEKNVKHGRYSEWAKNGTMRLDCQFQHNQLEGAMQFFDKKGKLSKTQIWEKGKLVKEVTFYAKGKVKKEKEYAPQTGELTVYSRFSRKQTCNYKIHQTQGKYAQIYYDKTGKEVKRHTFSRYLLPFL